MYVCQRSARDFCTAQDAVAVGVVEGKQGLDVALCFGLFDLAVAVVSWARVLSGSTVPAGGMASRLSIAS